MLDADFAKFVRAHRGYVACVLARSGVGGADVEELRQEVFLLVFRRWGTLELAGIRRWLRVVIGYVATNHRMLSRNRREVLMSEPPEVQVPSFDPELMDQTLRYERRMRGMSRKLRQVFDRHVLGGESIREIAAEIGVKEAAVYKRAKMARGWMGWD